MFAGGVDSSAKSDIRNFLVDDLVEKADQIKYLNRSKTDIALRTSRKFYRGDSNVNTIQLTLSCRQPKTRGMVSTSRASKQQREMVTKFKTSFLSTKVNNTKVIEMRTSQTGFCENGYGYMGVIDVPSKSLSCDKKYFLIKTCYTNELP